MIMKRYVLIDDANGVFENIAYKTEDEAKIRFYDVFKEEGQDFDGDLAYVRVEEIEVPE